MYTGKPTGVAVSAASTGTRLSSPSPRVRSATTVMCRIIVELDSSGAGSQDPSSVPYSKPARLAHLGLPLPANKKEQKITPAVRALQRGSHPLHHTTLFLVVNFASDLAFRETILINRIRPNVFPFSVVDSYTAPHMRWRIALRWPSSYKIFLENLLQSLVKIATVVKGFPRPACVGSSLCPMDNEMCALEGRCGP